MDARGGDRFYHDLIAVDDDVREEYWSEIRELPECKDQKVIRSTLRLPVE